MMFVKRQLPGRKRRKKSEILNEKRRRKRRKREEERKMRKKREEEREKTDCLLLCQKENSEINYNRVGEKKMNMDRWKLMLRPSFSLLSHSFSFSLSL